MTPEGKIKAQVKEYLKSIGAWQFWPVSNGMGTHGIPDCIACYRGMFLSIETKAPGKKPSALQSLQGNLIREARGIWMIIDGEEKLMKLKTVIGLIDDMENSTDPDRTQSV